MKSRWLIAAVLSATLLLAATSCTGPAVGPTEPTTTAISLDCGGAKGISHSFKSGAAWSMCWKVDAKQGLVLSNVNYQAPGKEPQLIIRSIALAQMEVPYDTGERLTADITSAGFGGTRMQTLTAAECSGDRVAVAIPNIGDGTHGSSPEREVLCSEEKDAGLAYRSYEQGQLTTARASEWNLSTISKVGWYEYIAQYTFGSDGSIKPLLGATGDLSPVDYTDAKHGSAIGKGESDHAASHSHNVVWSVHWGLGNGTQKVEQYDAAPTGQNGSKSPIVEGKFTPIDTAATAKKADRRWWGVIAPDSLNDDGRPISYEIKLAASDSFTFVQDQHEHGGDTGYDVAFTNSKDCQVFATGNRGSCGDGVLDYVAQAKGEALSDVVSWVAVGFHHVPRDEDQSPMELHWQGFYLGPRGLLAQRPGIPEERKDLNGKPTHWEGEDVGSLVEPRGQ
ncbi:MAG: copper amine oxidase [Renibacterium sp.]|nr:copper amine oxidase [Renibacterium sp.]